MHLRRVMVLILIGSTVVRYCYSAGTASAQFLKLGVGARNAAMGETGVTGANAMALFWNPAGIQDIERNQIAVAHTEWLEGITFQNAAYVHAMGKSAAGISATYLSMSSIDKYDNTGIKLSESFQPSDSAFALSYARAFGAVPVGISVKYVSSSLDTYTATAFAFDAGAAYDIYAGDMRKLRAGIAVRNIGGSLKYNRESFQLPTSVTAGVSCFPLKQLEVALDGIKFSDTDPAARAGAEYTFTVSGKSSLAARAGYISNAKGFDGNSGVTAGVGLGFGSVGLDYAFVPYGEDNTAHRISMTFGF